MSWFTVYGCSSGMKWHLLGHQRFNVYINSGQNQLIGLDKYEYTVWQGCFAYTVVVI